MTTNEERGWERRFWQPPRINAAIRHLWRRMPIAGYELGEIDGCVAFRMETTDAYEVRLRRAGAKMGDRAMLLQFRSDIPPLELVLQWEALLAKQAAQLCNGCSREIDPEMGQPSAVATAPGIPPRRRLRPYDASDVRPRPALVVRCDAHDDEDVGVPEWPR